MAMALAHFLYVSFPWWLADICRLSLSFSQNSPSLVTLPTPPAWLLTNQRFIITIQVTNLYKVQEHYPTAHIVEGKKTQIVF